MADVEGPFPARGVGVQPNESGGANPPNISQTWDLRVTVSNV